jgi:hypothetical protein
MLARTICTISFAFAFIPIAGFAGDVAYRLDTHALTPPDESKVLNLQGLQLRDRVWAAPGIEEANSELEPPQKFDYKSAQRIHIVHATGSRPMFNHACEDGPAWLDEVALPRTREMYGLGRNYDDSDWDNRQVFTFGGITLQR